jgi:hypothetical protein
LDFLSEDGGKLPNIPGETDLLIFDRMGRKQNRSVYDAVRVTSAAEAEFAVSTAEAPVQKVAFLPG